LGANHRGEPRAGRVRDPLRRPAPRERNLIFAPSHQPGVTVTLTHSAYTESRTPSRSSGHTPDTMAHRGHRFRPTRVNCHATQRSSSQTAAPLERTRRARTLDTRRANPGTVLHTPRHG